MKPISFITSSVSDMFYLHFNLCAFSGLTLEISPWFYYCTF